MRHFTPRRPWAPLTDDEWNALAPFVARAEHTAGRPLDQRTRFEAVLHNAHSGDAWRDLPQHYGRGDTVARHFRRWTHAGLWQRILHELASPNCPQPLKAMEYWLCRAARRAMRMLKMSGLDLAQKLGFLTALPMLPWFLPNHRLLAATYAAIDDALADAPRIYPPRGLLNDLGRMLVMAGGRAVWSKKYAPP